MKKILGVCGLGNTGSFAAIDLLREYDEVYFNNKLGEFPFCYTPDGILDLEYHLMTSPSRYEACDAAFYRFEDLVDRTFPDHKGEENKQNSLLRKISKEYIDNLTQITWSGTWSFRYRSSSEKKKILTKVFFKLMKYIGEEPYIRYTSELLRFSIRPDNFYSETKSYLRKIIENTSPEDAEIIIVDQVFPGDNPEKCFKFFDNPSAIIVDRDPRDLFLFSKCEIRAWSTWIPTDSVKDFIQYYKLMRLRADKISDPSRVLRIKYEDLIYDYDNSIKQLERFLGISKHSKAGTRLKTEISINNTQQFLKHPQFKDEICRIEDELADWIYDFDRFEKKPNFETSWKNQILKR